MAQSIIKGGNYSTQGVNGGVGIANVNFEGWCSNRTIQLEYVRANNDDTLDLTKFSLGVASANGFESLTTVSTNASVSTYNLTISPIAVKNRYVLFSRSSFTNLADVDSIFLPSSFMLDGTPQIIIVGASLLRVSTTLVLDQNSIIGYKWFRNGVYYCTTYTPQLAITNFGVFTAQILFAGGCSSDTTASITMYTLPTKEKQADIKSYPNPASTVFHIESLSDVSVEKVIISDVSGKQLETHSIVAGADNAISLSGLQTGMYQLQYLDKNEAILAKERLLVLK